MSEVSGADWFAIEDNRQLPVYSRLPIALVRGEGSFVWDSEGRRYLDFYGGHCVTALGHCPPRVVTAIQEQAAELLFYSNVVYSPVRAAAADLLASLAPEGLRNVFFGNSGTEANETALKLARTSTGRTGVIAMEGGFHGRTLGSIAATGIEKFRAPYRDVLPPAHFVPFGDADAVADVLVDDDDIAAVILEPIQSMAGMTVAPDSYFVQLRRLCDQHGVKLIFDEVQTGVGRTGAFTFAQRIGVTPDLITLAKSLGSGVPVGAVLASDAIRETVQNGDQGTTFGGGMLAMAAVKSTLDELVDGRWMDHVSDVYNRLEHELSSEVVAIRGRGCLIGIELDFPASQAVALLRERGVLSGSSSDPNTMRLMPPLNISDDEIDVFVDAFRAVLTEIRATTDA